MTVTLLCNDSIHLPYFKCHSSVVTWTPGGAPADSHMRACTLAFGVAVLGFARAAEAAGQEAYSGPDAWIADLVVDAVTGNHFRLVEARRAPEIVAIVSSAVEAFGKTCAAACDIAMERARLYSSALEDLVQRHDALAKAESMGRRRSAAAQRLALASGTSAERLFDERQKMKTLLTTFTNAQNQSTDVCKQAVLAEVVSMEQLHLDMANAIGASVIGHMNEGVDDATENLLCVEISKLCNISAPESSGPSAPPTEDVVARAKDIKFHADTAAAVLYGLLERTSLHDVTLAIKLQRESGMNGIDFAFLHTDDSEIWAQISEASADILAIQPLIAKLAGLVNANEVFAAVVSTGAHVVGANQQNIVRMQARFRAVREQARECASAVDGDQVQRLVREVYRRLRPVIEMDDNAVVSLN